MKILKFFILRIFFKRPLLVVSMILLLFIANYLTFTAARSVISTYQGYQEMGMLNKKGNYVANLDPKDDVNFDKIKKTDTQKVYTFLNNNYNYAFRTDGFVTSLKNKKNMEVSLNYINEESYKLSNIDLTKGKDMTFDYNYKEEKIPVLIGSGLLKSYPLGTTIKITDSVTKEPITLKVQGILKKNTHHSNFYAPNSKNYFNFSIFVPVNKHFINNSNLDLQVNGLMDIVILDTNKKKATELSQFMQKNLDMKFNFFSQQENFHFFEDYYFNSMKMISIISIILIIVMTVIAIWNTLMSIRLMIKDFTINLLVGLSYSKLRLIFYSYFGILFSINLAILFIITAYNRYGNWLRKDSLFATYGIFGLINMDWVALIAVVLIDIIIGLIIVEISIKRIKKIPISLGVLQ
ncbi:peptide ABC transporter permease (plasmid) [Mammaliicoccus sciuri]